MASTDDYAEVSYVAQEEISLDHGERASSATPSVPTSTRTARTRRPSYTQPAASCSYAPFKGFDEEDVKLSPGGSPSAQNEDAREYRRLASARAVILHEDKNYYPSAEELYGPEVEEMVQENDTQPLTEPIVAPSKVRRAAVEEKGLPETRYDEGFMIDMMNHPDMIENAAVVGHLHHGKTALMDMLVFETHKLVWNSGNPLRYTDAHLLASDRQISNKSTPMSLVLQNTRSNSHLCPLIDTSGHVNFLDEVATGCRFLDGVVLMDDVVEGVMVGTEQILRHCIVEGFP